MPMMLAQFGGDPPPPPPPDGPYCSYYGIECPAFLDTVPPWASDPEGGTWGGPMRYGISRHEAGNYADYLINWEANTLGFLFSVVVVGFCIVFLVKTLGGAFR